MSDAVHLLANIRILASGGEGAGACPVQPAAGQKTRMSDGKTVQSQAQSLASDSAATGTGSVSTPITSSQAALTVVESPETSSVTTSQQRHVQQPVETADSAAKQHQPVPRARSSKSKAKSKAKASRHTSLSPEHGGQAAEAARPLDKRRFGSREATSTERSRGDLLVQAKQTGAERKAANKWKSYFLRPVVYVVGCLTSILLSPVRLGVYAWNGARWGLGRILDYFFGSIYRSFIMSVCVATRRSDTDGFCPHGMPRRLQLQREPARPPSPDLSHLTDEEKQLLAATVGRLKSENERELMRIR